jgi:acyl carrier protein
VSTGERLTADLAQRLVGRGSTLWNLYGPTETTIWSTGVRVENPREIITIGRPLANTRALILDANMQLLPVGAAGELFLGGDGLARGYLGRPDLTAERFVPDPFSKVAGARLYRTGDLSRFLPDGSIEFLGRLDHQVKIRGYRIELGEIESALSQHPRVRTAAVVATDTASDEPRLVAHVVADLDRLIAVRELRTFLKGKLPEYMVPAEIVLRDRLPLTANGKVDRRALMADKPPVPEDRVEPLAEGSEMQRRMIELWRGLLNVATVRLEDSFFDLGGHSLLAMRLIARVERAFGVAPPLRSLFEQPTLAGFCRRCEALLREEHPSTVAAADRIQGRL